MAVSIRDFIDEGIESFVRDPADSDFQRGYLACLVELHNSFEDGTVE